jgi:hypothetical protein
MYGRAALLLIGLAAAFVLSSCRRAIQSASVADPYAKDWAVDPGVPGPDLPPVGHSLFDALVPDPVPFPFSRLLESINSKVGPGAEPRRVLIPLGRSLQRSAGGPEFFRYPRAVAVYDSERPQDREFVKDRLFLGYQEKAGVIEVISYNEPAGRFEFQLVENYREGGTPRVSYASRIVCTTCHQNHGPLFPRQLWDETNSNSRVSGLLLAESRDYYGFPIQQSADVPYAIDLAVHRANEVSACQVVWRHCSVELRVRLIKEMLRCRLTGACESPGLALTLGDLWRRTWPRGLRLPNPEIANRNPLAILSREGPSDRLGATVFLASRQKTIEAQFEPAVRRPPLDVWPGDADHVNRVLAVLSSTIGSAEIERLDAYLGSAPAERVEYRSRCDAGAALRCNPAAGGGFTLSGRIDFRGGKPFGSIALLGVKESGAVRDLDVEGGTLRRAGGRLHARCGDGNRIDSIRFEGRQAILTCSRDFDRLGAAIDSMAKTGALAAPVCQPASILKELYATLGRPTVEYGERASRR